MTRYFLTVMAGLTLLSCGGSADTIVDDMDVRSAAETSAADAVVLPDLASEMLDLTLDFSLADALLDVHHSEMDADLPWQPEPGELGYPCDSSDDCLSGYCIQTLDGRVCTVTCVDECPWDWGCAVDQTNPIDPVYVCTPPFVSQCRPCTTNAQCWLAGLDLGERCMDLGPVGLFCGSPCGEDGSCPVNYVCQTAVDATGEETDRCLPESQVCTCNSYFADIAAHTTCYVENDWGTCHGERQCAAAGLTPCSAVTPAQEICNGVDDDCDEAIDEETGGDKCYLTNEFGSCPGLYKCDQEALVCEGEEAQFESCDGNDNDCDGVVDEGFEDTDGDGLADCLESDIDGDGTPDVQDNCPAVPNATQEDLDLDNFGDACDLDDDNDGVADDDDCAPLNEAVFPGAEELCNGIDDDCNLLVDEGFVDTDADGWKDCVDDDDDNDGAVDDDDCAPLNYEIGPAALENCDGVDNDCDEDIDEQFPDLDDDGDKDCVDPDDDGDGIEDLGDNCPQTANEAQLDGDQDGIGDACDQDADGDSIPDGLDNCPGLPNTQQSDIDQDGLGDDCDDDMDGDDVLNGDDNCPFVANQGQQDTDQDGTGDACEADKDGDGTIDTQDCAPLNPGIHPGAKELCDGVDNNCDLAVDNGYPDFDLDGVKDCTDDDDDNDGTADDGDCQPQNPAVHPLAVEICDGIDNDCNDLTDDELGTLACGKGVCFHTVPSCLEGVAQQCDPFLEAAEEVCDGKDNDCNGLTDESLGSTTCGLGNCAHTVPHCQDGEPVLCDPLEGAAPELCDGQDNNCNGLVDDGLGSMSCGLGACEHSQPACVDGAPAVCDPLAGATIEVCDGLDNNCEGQIDEALGVVSCGQGQCQHEMPYCENGKTTVCNPFLGASVETCDAADNDCNGLADDGLPPVPCGTGVCAQILPGCQEGSVPICDPMKGAGDELCDGVDNDCDGQVDEGFGFSVCGLGVCLHAVANCENGTLQVCDPLAGAGEEVCDNLDNDCDGKTDPQDSVDCIQYFKDLDGDGFGIEGDSQCLCAPAAPYSGAEDGDCDDLVATTNPAQEEDCSTAADDDCSGAANEGCWYLSCQHALAQNPGTVSGAYALDTDGDDGPLTPFKAWCDMETDGGGWTLIMTTSSTSAYTYSNPVWTATNGGSDDPAALEVDADYVSRAFYELEGTESRMALGQQDYWNSWTHAKNTARNLSNQPRMNGSYGAASTCPAKTNCGTEPVHKRPLGLQQATSSSSSNKWNRFGYVNDVNGWGTSTRVGFTGDNDSSDSSDSIMGMGVHCHNACLSGSCTGAPHGMGSGFYLYHTWAASPYDGSVRGWLWIR